MGNNSILIISIASVVLIGVVAFITKKNKKSNQQQ
jgi:hypothetical protein